jgi:4-azaleucine resistance transporter AzlC
MMNEFKTAIQLSLPVWGAYWFLGITYGLLAVNLGFSIWIPISMALLIYSGSVEFIALTLLLGAFHPMAAAVMALMVGARHLFYGIAMLGRYRGAGRIKPLLIFWLTDETFAVNFANATPRHRGERLFVRYLWVSVLNYFYWVSGGMMGYLLGVTLGESLLKHLEGLDFVVTAMFVAIFMDDYVRHKATRLSSWLGVGAAAVCLWLFGAQQFIIPTMLCILAALFIDYRRNNP